jgi:hypothetical protein
MKKVIFILLLTIGAGYVGHGQLLKILKTKAKAAVDNSVDRSTNKVVDKVINNPADKVTDTVLTKAGNKVDTLIKKIAPKNKKPGDPEQPVPPLPDSTVTQPVAPLPDTTVAKPQNQNQ